MSDRAGTMSTARHDPQYHLPCFHFTQDACWFAGKVFEPTPDERRKVIVAINSAETSLTVDCIFYMVDAGYSKLRVFNPEVDMDVLQITARPMPGWRTGRAGCTGSGSCYRLCTEIAFRNEMFPNTIPDIQRTKLANTAPAEVAQCKGSARIRLHGPTS
ncbi:hypothetical protein B0H21DRAFT_340493 [Amylocystis lapponica]|nr:hypothetical protein B0H21DRAFT_340493 [Amylocystis lapponica]